MILDRYLIREVVKPLFIVVLLLVGIFMAYSLTKFLTDANNGVLNASAIFQLTGLKVLIALEVLIPIGLYIGIIVTLGRLYSDSEMVALNASGVSELRVVTPVIVVAVIISMLVSAFSLWVRPWAYAQLYQWQIQATSEIQLDDLQVGRFNQLGKSNSDRLVFFNNRNNKSGELSGLFIRSKKGDTLEIISAERGKLIRVEGAGTITGTTAGTIKGADRTLLDLQDAFVYQRGEEQRDLLGYFAKFSIFVSTPETEPLGHKPKATPTSALYKLEDNEDRAEMQWRTSTFVSTLLLTLLAFPLSRTPPRSGGQSRVFFAVIAYILYVNFMGVARSAVEQGTFPTLWWAPGLLAILLLLGMLNSRRVAR